MKWWNRLNLFSRIKKLERDFTEKKAELEKLIARS